MRDNFGGVAEPAHKRGANARRADLLLPCSAPAESGAVSPRMKRPLIST